MDKTTQRILYMHFIESKDPREIWVRAHRKARIEKAQQARYEIAKVTGKVPNPIKHLHDVSNDGQYVQLFDNTDPREPMLSTDIPKTRVYRIAEALAVVGTKETISEKQAKKIKAMTEKQILDINRCSEGIHPDPDSVKDPDEMKWCETYMDMPQEDTDYSYEQLSTDRIEEYARTYPKAKELTKAETELQKAWNKFLKDHSNLVVEEFFEFNYIRCFCTEPNIVHNEAFCPRCYHPNAAYHGFVAVYQGSLLTTQDMLYMRLTTTTPGLDLINASDAYIASQDRITHKIMDVIVLNDHSTETVHTIRMDNTDL